MIDPDGAAHRLVVASDPLCAAEIPGKPAVRNLRAKGLRPLVTSEIRELCDAAASFYGAISNLDPADAGEKKQLDPIQRRFEQALRDYSKIRPYITDGAPVPVFQAAKEEV